MGPPVSSVILVVVLLGDEAVSQMPWVIVGVVAAMVVEETLSSWTAPNADAGRRH